MSADTNLQQQYNMILVEHEMQRLEYRICAEMQKVSWRFMRTV